MPFVTRSTTRSNEGTARRGSGRSCRSRPRRRACGSRRTAARRRCSGPRRGRPWAARAARWSPSSRSCRSSRSFPSRWSRWSRSASSRSARSRSSPSAPSRSESSRSAAARSRPARSVRDLVVRLADLGEQDDRRHLDGEEHDAHADEPPEVDCAGNVGRERGTTSATIRANTMKASAAESSAELVAGQRERHEKDATTGPGTWIAGYCSSGAMVSPNPSSCPQ